MGREGQRSGAEERLARIERLLEMVLRKLQVLEEYLAMSGADPEASLAVELAMVFSLPAHKAVRMASKVMELARMAGISDPISITILEVLAISNKPLTVSEVTRRVRKVRGTASRRIVTERIRKLSDKGLVKVRKAGKKILVSIE